MRSLLFVPALMLACANPRVTAVAERREPLAVSLSLPATVPDRARLEELFAEEVRLQLRGRVNVIAADQAVPEGAVKLMLSLRLDEHVVATEAAQGAVHGDLLGTSYSLGRGKSLLPAMGNGLLTGSILGGLSAAGSATRLGYHTRRLGYQPSPIVCDIALQDGPGPVRPLGTTGEWEVVKCMRPLALPAQGDPDGRRKEEARALAQAVVARLARLGRWEAR